MVIVRNITKVFHPGEVNEVIAVADVSFQIPEGQFLTVIGGNGSGKSTLLNLLAGTFFADKGTIKVADEDVTHLPEFRRARLIGRVFQDPLMGTSAGLTIEENFALAESRGKFRGLGPALNAKVRSEIRDHLAMLGLGLENRMRAKVGLLSGGQRQAITILMAVFRRPRVLLLDEHTAALDPRASRKIMELTREIVESQRLTTLMVTHNLAHALNSGERIIMMSRGQIIRDLPKETFRAMTPQDLLGLFWETQKPEDAPAGLEIAPNTS
ncbi:MAG: ATP-binding cassette domain-containing protein [Desulfomonile tiedjei]|nr:ATP-binding cassette domain-containing protein [Desulfomonile tiedjei]